MPGITVLPANLAALVLESCLYGILLLLFISTLYFLASRRTLAGHNQPTKHHFTSLPFLGVTALFLVITAHWSLAIYQSFFSFINLGSADAESAFYTDLSQSSEIAKYALVFTSILLGEFLVIHRLWIIWGRNRWVPLFPIGSSIGVLVSCIGILYETIRPEPGLLFAKEMAPWVATGFALSLITNVYSTAFIAYRISRIARVKSVTESRLLSFLAILVESAALQTFWLSFTAITMLATAASPAADYIVANAFPPIIGIANLLIHARVGLGWSQDATPQSRTTNLRPNYGIAPVWCA
ncbi:hypothetical protein C8R44DRAFT_868541 [Mycena epipterygia]|nr:hypothetical protein C8R44DRAFT_868541 [Mycena epipterygia]